MGREGVVARGLHVECVEGEMCGILIVLLLQNKH